nr:hypothetical protein [Tanacetum cinerariifolium]
MYVEIEQDDLNQQFLTSLAPEWLMYTIVWRNRDDLDTMSLDDVYNHHKVYEPKVQNKSDSNSQNMAFISSSNTSSGKGEVHTASVPTASTQVSTASIDVVAASISHDTWNMALLSMRADRFWKNTFKKIIIQGSDVAGFEKSKVECFNCHKMGHFARECRAPRSQDRGKRESYKQGPKEEEPAPKALMAIDGIRWDWSYMANEEENHALIADDEALTKFALMAKSSSSFENEDLSWIELPEFVDDTVTDYSRHTPSIDSSKSNIIDLQNSNSFVFEHGESSSSIMSKPMIKFAKVADYLEVIKTNKTETARKSPIKYVEMYKNTSKSPKVRGNQRNWNNLKSQQLGKDFLMQKGICFKCGHFDHLAFDCGGWVEKRKTWPTNNFANKNVTPRAVLLRTGRTPKANNIDDKGYWDSGCSCHMTGNISYLSEYEPYDGGYVSFGQGRGNITGKGKFDAKGDEGYFVGYSMSSKAFKVFNKRTKKVEENLHVEFLENKLIEKGAGPNWLFDIDTLTNSMKYVLVVITETSSTNISAHMESSNNDAQDACNADAPKSSGISNLAATLKSPPAEQMESLTVESVIPIVNSPVPTTCLDISLETSSDTRLISKGVTSQEETPSLDNILTLSTRFEDILGDTTNTVDTNRVEADLSNMKTSITASPTPTFRIHKDHPKSQIIGPVDTPEEPKKIFDALKDLSWVEAMQEARLQFKIQNVWILVDCPKGVEGIDYEVVFAPVARIKAIRLFLAYASFMGFIVYQMDVKSAFLYGTIDEEVYVMQPPGFQDPEFLDRVYKVEKAMYGLHQALRAWYGTLSKYLLANGFQRGTIDQTLFIRKHRGKFLLVQVSANTPMDKENPWGKDGPGKDVELHLYRSMIGSSMYLTASRLDIMFAVCTYARHQVTPKECHLYVVKRIFRYLKGHPKMGLWYPKESPFDLVAYSD